MFNSTYLLAMPRFLLLWSLLSSYAFGLGLVWDQEIQPERHHFINDDFASSCRFNIGKFRYDLCPLFRQRPIIIDVPQTLEGLQKQYRWDFKGKSSRTAGSQCPRGTWICLTETKLVEPNSLKVSHSIPIAGNPPGRIPQEESSTVIFSNNEVFLHLNTGHKDGYYPLHAHIRLICDPKAKVPTNPAFKSESSGVHSFSWTSRYACSDPLAASNNIRIFEEDRKPADDTMPDAPSDEDESQDLLGPPKSSRNIMAWTIVITGTIVAVVGFVIYFHPPTQLKGQFPQLLTPPFSGFHILRSIPWIQKEVRTDDTVLVRWAEEEMGVDEEEDFMVNGSDSLSEYMPLRRDFNRKKQLKDYGSARFW